MQVKSLTNISKKVLNFNYDYTGKGVTIAYIDTGIFPHLDFTLGKKRIVYFADFVNNLPHPYDDNGHGSFVSGVGSGNGISSGFKFAGMAPESNIIALKALNSKGEANASIILQAMDWIKNNAENFNIRVVCMSFGSDSLGENDPIKLGAEKLWNAGIAVVAAAGNSGPNYQTIKSPGISPKIITVGGINDNRNSNAKNYIIAPFSSRGPALANFKPDIVAPSVDITSCKVGGGYTVMSGTSVATPMIAGMLALAYEKNPKLTPTQLKKLLLNSASAITYNLNYEGFGLPDAQKFLSSI